jgi:hypothetical protein
MQLNEEQKQRVAGWIADGMKLSDIQDAIGREFDIRLTYMDVRLIVDDLKLTPKDVEPPAATPDSADVAAPVSPLAAPAPAPAGKVSLTVDQLARPGAMVSGQVTFSDGKSAQWHVDQYGRLGIVAGDAGYRPPAGDVQEFQAALDRELQRLGY